jgi:cysteine-rich repeat protein
LINGDGCSSLCIEEYGYICRKLGNSTSDSCYIPPNVCGDGFRQSAEACDDSNLLSGDGCSSACTIESGFGCTGGSLRNKDVCALAVCGNGRREATEGLKYVHI